MNSKYNYHFIGLIIVPFLPGGAHILSGHWKTGMAWYFSAWGVICTCFFVLSLPFPLSFATIIVVQLLAMIYVILLFVSSYRPTRRLGCGGWVVFLFLAGTTNIIASEAIAHFIKNHIGRVSPSMGTSMYPTIKTIPSHRSDWIARNALAYRSEDPCRGDIVGISMTSGEPWIKRVVGLPGETIDIQPPYVLINGEKLLWPLIFAKISLSEDGYSGYDTVLSRGREGIVFPITLGSNEYLLLGDNSANSTDSRMFGPVPREAIQGKVVRIIFPPWRIREL